VRQERQELQVRQVRQMRQMRQLRQLRQVRRMRVNSRYIDNLGTRLSRLHVQLSTHRPHIDD
jgi:hypothetical protein